MRTGKSLLTLLAELAAVLALLVAVAGLTEASVSQRFDERIDALEARNAELDGEKEQLTARMANLSLSNQDLQRQVEEMIRRLGAPRPPAPPDACGVNGAMLRLCEGRSESFSDGGAEISLELVRVDMSGNSPRAFMLAHVGARPVQMIDAFSGETPAIRAAGGDRRIEVRAVSADPPAVVIDVSPAR